MKILIVEDEARIAKRIDRMTRDFFKDTLHSLNCVESLEEAKKHIEKSKPDLVLLDLNLNGDDGFDVLKANVSESFDTIIISAQRNLALTSFEYGVLDFVPKPFNRERLEQAFQRTILKDKIVPSHIRFLAVKKRNHIQLINIDDVLYIQGAGVYAELYLNNGKKELHNKSLEKIEQLLPDTFWRIHKSYLVKMTAAKEIIVKSGSKYELKLENDVVLPIGRTKYKEIKERWF